MQLVMDHARQRLALRHLQAEHELQLPAGFVENVGHAVAAFGDIQRIIGKDIREAFVKRFISVQTLMPPLTTYLP